MFETRATCRSCESTELAPVLALGDMPLADALLTEEQLSRPEPVFPLTVAFCRDCALMQIKETVSPEMLFGTNYPYYSSFSETLLQHSRTNALELIESRRLGHGSLVVEIASNDGYLLRNFKEAGIPVLGIDPADGPAQAARDRGIETLSAFFGRELASDLRATRGEADVIIANNVLAHVPDLNGFVQGMATLLKPDGVIVIEAPYVRDLIEHCEFDTIYHEHHCYFSVSALVSLFQRHGLSLNDVRHLPIHGGSLRFYVEKTRAPSEAVRSCLQAELEAGLQDTAFYRDFGDRVRGIRDGLRQLVAEAKREGATIAAYGAAAKGATLLNYAGVGTDVIDFVVDRNVHKHGLHMPGVHIPIEPPERLLEHMPDYVLLLAWNFKDEIMQQQAEYLDRGGRFIVPIPYPEVVGL